MTQETPTNTSMVKQGFGTAEHAIQLETAAASVAARAKAQIEARHIMALQRPRNIDEVRTRILKECNRPGFARAARYKIPMGGSNIEGPTIRFAEVAIRYMGNLAVETTCTYDDPQKQVLRVGVTDLEANVVYEQDVTVAKTVERKRCPPGVRALATRPNSYGQTVHVLEATDDEVLNKINALVSKALRTLSLRHLPGDILDEAMVLCIRVAANEDAKDPDAARKALVDGFFALGVDASQLSTYLGHGLDSTTPAEVTELRAIFAALRDEETVWQEIMDSKFGTKSDGDEEPSAQTSKVKDIIDQHKKTQRNKKKQKQKSPDPETGEVHPDDEPPEPGAAG